MMTHDSGKKDRLGLWLGGMRATREGGLARTHTRTLEGRNDDEKWWLTVVWWLVHETKMSECSGARRMDEARTIGESTRDGDTNGCYNGARWKRSKNLTAFMDSTLVENGRTEYDSGRRRWLWWATVARSQDFSQGRRIWIVVIGTPHEGSYLNNNNIIIIVIIILIVIILFSFSFSRFLSK